MDPILQISFNDKAHLFANVCPLGSPADWRVFSGDDGFLFEVLKPDPEGKLYWVREAPPEPVKEYLTTLAQRAYFPQTILIRPDVGENPKLLNPGICGYTPPLAHSGVLCGHAYHRDWKTPEEYARHADCYMCGEEPYGVALVLAWRGEKVPAGIFHAWHMTDHVGADALMHLLHEATLRELAEAVELWSLGQVMPFYLIDP